MKTNVRLYVVAVLVIVLTACAGMTPKQKYLAARTAFNDILEQFNTWAAVQPEETKVKLRTSVIPVIDDARSALDEAKYAAYLGTADASVKLQYYLGLKNKLINLIAKYGLKIEQPVVAEGVPNGIK